MKFTNQFPNATGVAKQPPGAVGLALRTLALGAAASPRTRADADGSGPSVPGGQARNCARALWAGTQNPGALRARPASQGPGIWGSLSPAALILQMACTEGRGPGASDEPATSKRIRMFSINAWMGGGKGRMGFGERSQKNFSSGVHLFSAVKCGTM